MKRFLAMVIAMLLCFGLSACNASGDKARIAELESQVAELQEQSSDSEANKSQEENAVNDKQKLKETLAEDIAKEISLDAGDYKIAYIQDGSVLIFTLFSDSLDTMPIIELEVKYIDNLINRVLDEKELHDVIVSYQLIVGGNQTVGLRKTNPQIGMTETEVKYLSWGEPDKINRDTTKHGVSEQWIYDSRGYLYFDDGILTSIQER